MVQLERWNEETSYTRTGLGTETAEILEVEIPRVTIPLNPGKNITVISEVVAMNHLLKYAGVESAAVFNRRLQNNMQQVREDLQQDYE